MLNKSFSRRFVSVISLLFIFILIFGSIPVSAHSSGIVGNEDCIGISVNNEHKKVLMDIFEYGALADNYNLSAHSCEMTVGMRLDLDVIGSLYYDQYDEDQIVWTSSDNSVVRVNQRGEIIALAVGTAEISAIANNAESKITFYVRDELGINLDEANMTVMKVTRFYTNILGDLSEYLYDVEWSTSSGDLAQVGSGLVLARQAGFGSVTARIYDRESHKLLNTSVCDIIVYPASTDVIINNPVTDLEVGDTYKIIGNTTPDNNKIILESADPGIVKIEQDGTMKAVGVGRTTIFAYAGCWAGSEYVKDSDVYRQFDVEVWSSDTREYTINLVDDVKGNVKVNKKSAFVGETVNVFIKDIVDTTSDVIDVRGPSVIDISDKYGNQVKVTEVTDGVYSFVMPSSNVTIEITYGSLYSINHDKSLNVNMSRNENTIAHITIDEYVGGSFNGIYHFTIPGVVISGADTSHGEVILGEDGSVMLNIDPHRIDPGKINITLYADAQDANGIYSVFITSSALNSGKSVELSGAFIACQAGEIKNHATSVNVDYVINNTINNKLTLSAPSTIVVYGEALEHIKRNNITLELKFLHGTLTIPGRSFDNFNTGTGDFTVFEFNMNDFDADDNIFGECQLTAYTYTSSGATINQLSLIGSSTLLIHNEQNLKLSLKTEHASLNPVNNIFALNTLAGYGNFTLVSHGFAIKMGDILFYGIIGLLLIALFIAVVFLVKKIKKQNTESDQETPNGPNPKDPDPDVNNEINDQDDESSYEEFVEPQEFKTIDDILKESNLEYENTKIKEFATDELKDEISREQLESSKSSTVLLTDDEISEIAFNASELKVKDKDDVIEKHTNFKILIQDADEIKQKASVLLSTDCSTEDIHKMTDDLRAKISELIAARDSYEDYYKLLNGEIALACDKATTIKDTKYILVNAIQYAKSELEKLDYGYKDMVDSIDDLEKLIKEKSKFAESISLDTNPAETTSHAQDLYEATSKVIHDIQELRTKHENQISDLHESILKKISKLTHKTSLIDIDDPDLIVEIQETTDKCHIVLEYNIDKMNVDQMINKYAEMNATYCQLDKLINKISDYIELKNNDLKAIANKKVRDLAQKEKLEYDNTINFINTHLVYTIPAQSEINRLKDLAENIHSKMDEMCNSDAMAIGDIDIENLDKDINKMVETRTVLEENIDEIDVMVLPAKRIGRKKITYWEKQAESSDPKVACFARSKLAAHKARIKEGVASRKADEARKAEKKNSVNNSNL